MVYGYVYLDLRMGHSSKSSDLLISESMVVGPLVCCPWLSGLIIISRSIVSDRVISPRHN